MVLGQRSMEESRRDCWPRNREIEIPSRVRLRLVKAFENDMFFPKDSANHTEAISCPSRNYTMLFKTVGNARVLFTRKVGTEEMTGGYCLWGFNRAGRAIPRILTRWNIFEDTSTNFGNWRKNTVWDPFALRILSSALPTALLSIQTGKYSKTVLIIWQEKSSYSELNT